MNSNRLVQLSGVVAAVVVVLIAVLVIWHPGTQGTSSDPCQIAVGSTFAGEGGRVDWPGGTFSNDPQAQISYDPITRHWYPVGPGLMSPDRGAYVHLVPSAHFATDLEMVNTANGAHRLVAEGVQVAYGWDANGIVLLVPATGGMEVRVLDPTSGVQRTVRQFNAADAPSLALLRGGDLIYPAADGIARLHLADGSVKSELTLGGRTDTAFPVGFDRDGHVVVVRAPFGGAGAGYLAVINNPGIADRIAGSEQIGVVAPNSSNGAMAVLADAHGLWIGAGDGRLWLIRPGQAPAPVATLHRRSTGAAGAPLPPVLGAACIPPDPDPASPTDWLRASRASDGAH
jgi:hypothetical protein